MGAFWGSAHVSEAITQWKKSNPLIDMDVFTSFPALSLPRGSRTSFKLQCDGSSDLYTGNVGGQSLGAIAVENAQMQLTVGAMGYPSSLASAPSTLVGALRYTVGTSPNPPTPPPTKSPTVVTSPNPPTPPPTKSPTVTLPVTTKGPTSPP